MYSTQMLHSKFVHSRCCTADSSDRCNMKRSRPLRTRRRKTQPFFVLSKWFQADLLKQLDQSRCVGIDLALLCFNKLPKAYYAKHNLHKIYAFDFQEIMKIMLKSIIFIEIMLKISTKHNFHKNCDINYARDYASSIIS